MGELGCVYADESLIAKETILVAYSQGIFVIETNTPHYSVAVVGLGYEDLSSNNINVMCHNGLDSSTITGSNMDQLIIERKHLLKVEALQGYLLIFGKNEVNINNEKC